MCLLLCLVFSARAQHPFTGESNQNIWLLNSNTQFISSLDSLVDRNFFESLPIKIQSLEPAPVDAVYEFDAYTIDSGKVVMMAHFEGPEFSPLIVKRMLLFKHETLFVLWVLGNKQGEEYGFVGSMRFQLKGNPKPVKDSHKKKHNQYALVNSKGRKVNPQDTLVSTQYFQANWVDLHYDKTPDSNQVCSVIIQPPEDGPMQMIRIFGTRMPQHAKDILANAAKGTKVFMINEPPDQTRTLRVCFTMGD